MQVFRPHVSSSSKPPPVTRLPAWACFLLGPSGERLPLDFGAAAFLLQAFGLIRWLLWPPDLGLLPEDDGALVGAFEGGPRLKRASS